MIAGRLFELLPGLDWHSVSSLRHQRRDSVCTNSLLVRRDELEESLLRGLSESVLRTEVIDFAVEKIEEALSAQFAGIDAELACLRQRKQALDSELKRLTDALAQGRQSQSVMAAIGEREAELRSITDRLLELRPGSLRAKLDELRTFAGVTNCIKKTGTLHRNPLEN